MSRFEIEQTGHIGLNVTDLERSIQFYKKNLGFKVLWESEDESHRFASLGENQSLYLTLWEQSDGSFPTDRPGLHHLSFKVENVEVIERIERRLRENGAEILHGGLVAHGDGQASGGLFFLDPDGIRLEIFAGSGFENHPAPTADLPTCGFF